MTSQHDPEASGNFELTKKKKIWRRLIFATFVFSGCIFLIGQFFSLTRQSSWQQDLPTVTAAMGALERGDTEVARAALHIWGERGDLFAQFNLGKMYQCGQGVDRSVTEAIKWYAKALRQREPSAMINLGLMYRLGDGVPKNFLEAAHLFRLAARYGDHLGSVYLGIMHEKGEGLFRNDRPPFNTSRRPRVEARSWGCII
jgi:TPR repeat protein